MAELKNRQWLIAARPQGIIKESDFRWNETAAAIPKEGEMLVRNLALSFDPTQRGWMSRDTYLPVVPIGEPMKAAGVGQVVESRKPGFAKGDLAQGLFAWEDYTATSGESILGLEKLGPGADPILALSLFGITGLTAYCGLLSIGTPKPGETCVVSGAAGATGSVAGMIAKIKGCRVVGIAGGPAKCGWLVKEAGFDAAIDYKNEKVGDALSRNCPKGIDIFFDNVGGEILDEVLARVNPNARVIQCGSISHYNDPEGSFPPPPKNYANLSERGGKMQAFLVIQYARQFKEARTELGKWLKEGRIKNQIDLAHGLENAPKTIIRLFTGANLGKQLLKIADPN